MTLTHESTALQSRLSEEAEALERLERMVELVDRLEATGKEGDPPLILDECAQAFQELQTNFYNEYKALGLSDLAVSVVHPILNEKLKSWEPLKVKTKSINGEWGWGLRSVKFSLISISLGLFIWFRGGGSVEGHS